MIRNFDTTSLDYQTRKPFPYYYLDDALPRSFATNLQNEILDIPSDAFDRYNNPFEQKYTLRDKSNYPKCLTELFSYLQSDIFIKYLSNFVGHQLILDTTKNFHGVHIYEKGDKLDIHVDAGIHPIQKLKKRVTLGIYLSKNWQEGYGCDLEIWEGENASKENPLLKQCVHKVAPLFNRLILFTNDDYSWHGNPEPATCPNDAKRIFVTISYLSEVTRLDCNKKQKAYFIKRPGDPEDPQKDKLRILRCDPVRFAEVYRSYK